MNYWENPKGIFRRKRAIHGGWSQKANIKNKKTKPSVSAIKCGWRKRGAEVGLVLAGDGLVSALTALFHV